jgi:UDP-glucose 4-epimerase
MNYATVAVTGATGLLGRHLVRKLVECGMRVRSLARGRVAAESGGAIMQCDIRDSTTLVRAFEGVDAIFHLAAYAHDVSSRNDSSEQEAITFGGTVAALNAARDAGVRHFIFASSMAVYGTVGDECVNEEYPCRPQTPYGRAKLRAEAAVAEFAASTGAFASCVRPAMIYGVPCLGNLARMIRAVEAGWFPPIPEFGNRRSMVGVSDVASAMMQGWRAHVSEGRVFNITDGEYYSTRQLYDVIRENLGRTPQKISLPPFVFSAAARFGDLVGAIAGRRAPFDSFALERFAGSACFDNSRAKRELSFVPTTTLYVEMPSLIRSLR